MKDPGTEVHKAVYDTLKADPALTALVGDAVYDEPPQGSATYPMVELGDEFGDSWDALDGWETVMTLNVWSRKPGRVECRQICEAVVALFPRDGHLELPTHHFVMADVIARNILDTEDGITTQGVIRLRIITHP